MTTSECSVDQEKNHANHNLVCVKNGTRKMYVTELGLGLEDLPKLYLIQLFALHVAKDAIEICLVLEHFLRMGNILRQFRKDMR